MTNNPQLSNYAFVTRSFLTMPLSPRVREVLLVLVSALAITSLIALDTRAQAITYEHPHFELEIYDHHKYIAMATGDPFDLKEAPFNRRVLTPLLAKALPFDIQHSFQVISFFGVLATGVAVYYLVKAFGLSTALAAGGMLTFFSLRWAAEFPLVEFWLPDPMSFLVTVLCIYCIISKRDFLFALLLVVGALNKESAVFVAPLFYTFRARNLIDPGMAARTALLTLPAILVLLALRFGIPQDNSYDLLAFLPGHEGGFVKHRLEVTLAPYTAIVLYILGPFSVAACVLSILAMMRIDNLKIFARFSPLLFLVYFSLTIVHDTQRILVLAFPALIVLSALGVQEIAQRLKISPWYFVPLPLLTVLWNLYVAPGFSFDDHVSTAVVPTSSLVPIVDQALILAGYLAVFFVAARWLRPRLISTKPERSVAQQDAKFVRTFGGANFPEPDEATRPRDATSLGKCD